LCAIIDQGTKDRTEVLINELTLLGGRQGGESGSSGYAGNGGYSCGNTAGCGQSQPVAKDECIGIGGVRIDPAIT
jgi:hypothetical protein